MNVIQLAYRPNLFEVHKIFCARLEDIMKEENTTSFEVKDYAHDVDSFQFHYLLWLCGYHKTKFRLNERFRNLINNPLFQENDFVTYLKEIESFLLKREMYEMLSVFTKTNPELIKSL